LKGYIKLKNSFNKKKNQKNEGQIKNKTKKIIEE
jgi:hypothetical protein